MTLADRLSSPIQSVSRRSDEVSVCSFTCKSPGGTLFRLDHPIRNSSNAAGLPQAQDLTFLLFLFMELASKGSSLPGSLSIRNSTGYGMAFPVNPAGWFVHPIC